MNHASLLRDEEKYTAEEYSEFRKASKAELQGDLEELAAMAEGTTPLASVTPTSAISPVEGQAWIAQTPWAWITLAAGIGLIVGSLLPWATLTAPFVGTVNMTATDGDGIITLIAGLVVGLIGVVAFIRGVGPVGLVLLFLILGLAAWVAVVDLGNVTNVVAEFDSEDFGAASVGIGLWLVTVATVIGFVGFGGLLMNRSKIESENKSLRDWFNWI
jgi:ElaB/YqjD/DUF883 family membrane-anchored ribosome-binding protein